MIWFPNFNPGRLIYFLLLVERDCNLELQALSVLSQSRGDFTIVFWPDRLGIRSYHRDSLHMSTVWRSTWWSRLWRLWRMSAIPGHSGEVAGLEPMLFTLNSPAPQNGHAAKERPPNRNP